jgi:hypothetical protein
MGSMAAWGMTLHTTRSLGTYATTGAEFMPATLGSGELASIGGQCASILGTGSGFGVFQLVRGGRSRGGEVPEVVGPRQLLSRTAPVLCGWFRLGAPVTYEQSIKGPSGTGHRSNVRLILIRKPAPPPQRGGEAAEPALPIQEQIDIL